MWDDNLRFRRKIPSVLFALLVMLLTCLFHFRSLDIVTPRYLAESVIGKGWSWRVYVLRMGYRIKVSLQKGGIAFGFDAAVEDAIISKETDCTIDGFVGEVVDVYQK